MEKKSSIIDGLKIAKTIREKIADKVAKENLFPGLGVIMVGDDMASKLYVSLKKKACAECGVFFSLYEFSDKTPQEEIINTIEWLNNDQEINGILVQLPLPLGYDEDEIISKIDPEKDVDGFHPQNIKKYLKNENSRMPGLVEGIIILLKETEQTIKNKKSAIIAKSDEFKNCLEKELENLGAKVEKIHPDDKNIFEKTPQADIIISAIGKPKLITKDKIKNESILIDVGTCKINNKTVGDVDFESCSKKASWISPVPGGVGPMTVSMLIKNTVDLFIEQKKLNNK